LTATEMFPAVLNGKVKGMIILGENPVVSDPDSLHIEKALKALDFLLVIDIFPTPTSDLAHIVLPGASFAEKEGTFSNTERRVQMVRKAIEPPGEARPDWRIIQEISNRFGYPMDYETPRSIMEEIAQLTPSYAGILYDRRVKLTDGAGRKIVFMPFHFLESRANVLTNPAFDPIAKIPEYKVCAVKIGKQETESNVTANPAR
jgi:predicted molibdopterin-dependent oxidoreductase YjgC